MGRIKTGLRWFGSALFLAACGGGTSDLAAALPAGIVPRFAYVANSGDDTVSIYAVNATTGQLRHNGYAATGALPRSVAVDPSGKFVYVANSAGNGGVSAYVIETTTGGLTPIDADDNVADIQPFPAGIAPWSVTLHPTGRFAYVANISSASVSAYTLDGTTGALTPIDADGGLAGIQNFPTGSQPHSVVVDPSGEFAYVANFAAASVSAYTIHVTTGVLTPIDADGGMGGIQNFPTGGQPTSVTVHPSAKYAYVVSQALASISAYTIHATTFALTEIDQNGAIAGTTVPTGSGPRSVTVDPTGKFAYVANAGAGSVSAYTVGAATGALTPIDADSGLAGIQNFPAGSGPEVVTVDPSGKFVYVANRSSNDIWAYSIDATTGALTALSTIAGRYGSQALAMTQGASAVTYSPKLAYVANGLDDTVSVYTINPDTGALSGVGTPAPAGITPQSIAVDPTGRFAYVANDGGGVSSYTIHPTTGVLSPIDYDSGVDGIQDFAAGTNPRAVTVAPTGRFAYVANYGSHDVSAFFIHPSNGSLAFFTAAVAAGSNPRSITIDPSGRFAYVANQTSGDVSAYTLGAASGVLTPIDADLAMAGIQNFPAGPDPFSVTVDPSGKFAYVANSFTGPGGNSISAYRIHASTGALMPIDADANTPAVENFPAGVNPRSITIDPTSRVAYVANFGSHGVSLHTIDTATGAFTGAVVYSTGNNPFFVAVDPSGKFAFVANFADDTVSAYRTGSGTLTSLGLAMAAGNGPLSVAITATHQ